MRRARPGFDDAWWVVLLIAPIVLSAGVTAAALRRMGAGWPRCAVLGLLAGAAAIVAISTTGQLVNDLAWTADNVAIQ